MNKLKNMWNLTVDELLNKVTWPTWDELKESAIIVIVASVILSAIIFLVDFVLGKGLDFIYSIF